MSRLLRVALVAALATALVTGGSSVAWALWTATGTAASSATIGKLAVAISGTEAITTTFSTSAPRVTRPVTITNAGNVAGTTATRVAVATGSAALAQAVDVQAWRVSSADACTDAADVGSGPVSGTWADLPSLQARLAPGAAAVWCVRSAVRADAPPSATVDVHLVATTATGSWVSEPVWGGFYLNTDAGAPALTCTDHDGNWVELTWDQGGRDQSTAYAAFVGTTQVGDRQLGFFGRITLAPNQVTTTTAGTVSVDVAVVDDAGQRTGDVVGRGPVTLFTQNDGPAIRCGA